MKPMQHDGSLQPTLRQFVLGSLDDPRRLDIEERLITEPDTFEALELVEAELMEDYVEGRLPRPDRQAFEDHFLTTSERCQQADLLRLLVERVPVQPAQAAERSRVTQRWDAWRLPPLWTGLLAASLCAAVTTAAWLSVRQADLRHEITVLRAEQALQHATPPSAAALSAVDNAPSTPAPMALLTVPLIPGMLRDGGTLARVEVPQQAQAVRFRLALTGPGYRSYRAVFYDADAEELWAASNLHVASGDASKSLTVVVPSELLRRGDYEIRLSGISQRGKEQTAATYRFRITSASF
jgi:hypothetical protein